MWTLLLLTPLLRAQSPDDAHKLFLISCAPCHGKTGQGAESQAEGVKPPDLTRGVFKSGGSDEDLYLVVAKGIPESGMPSFEQLGSTKIRSLVAYVRSLSQTQITLPGDPVKGEALFWVKGDCGRCHSIGSKGVRFGPDLTHGSRRNTAARLKRAIVAPDEEITPGYEIVTVVTRDNQTISGLARFFDNFSARVIDSSGNEHTYLRDEVRSISREMRSLMPAGYGETFTGTELDDLVSYILKVQNEARRQ